MKPAVFKAPESLIKRAKARAKTLDISFSKFVRKAIEEKCEAA